jgi:HEAT repeat protein
MTNFTEHCTTCSQPVPVPRLGRPATCGGIWLAGLVLALGLAADAPAVDIDFLMPGDPKIEVPPDISDISPKPLPLWIDALSSAEADLQREAAQTIALAHKLGMPNANTAVPALIAAMEDPHRRSSVVAAAAQALIVLDARQAAPQLLQRSRTGGLALARIIEPVLARWDFQPVRPIWLARLEDPNAGRAWLLLAIEGLATVGETKAKPRLGELAMTPIYAPVLRLAAARALARLQPRGWEDRVGKLPLDASTCAAIDRMVAATIVSRLDSPAAKQLLVRLAMDPEPAVAGIALGGLCELDFRAILPLADKLVSNDDANVRHWVAKAWVAERTVPAVEKLSLLLDDPHPGLRVYVRESLLALTSSAALRQPVIEGAGKMLATDRWRGLEQAEVIMAALDQKQTAGRLVQLLDHPRPEVYIAAAWGLRRLAVPSTAPALLRKSERLHALQKESKGTADLLRQARHLMEAMGLMHYAEAAPLLRKYIPKDLSLDGGARATAIWALGHIFAGKPQPDLVALLQQRLAELRNPRPYPLEQTLVIEMAAVSLGRMRATDAVPSLREFGGKRKVRDPAEYACGWALHVILGEPLPTFTEIRLGRDEWFLEPMQ